MLRGRLPGARPARDPVRRRGPGGIRGRTSDVMTTGSTAAAVAGRSADRRTAQPSFELDGEGPVYLQIERAVRSKIQSGAWPPGFRVPSALELMQVVDCSRATMNKAMTNLANARLIVRQRRHGSHVRQSTEEHAVLGVLDIRREIEASGRRYSYGVLEKRTLVAGTETAHWAEVEAGERVLALRAVHRGDDQAEVVEDRLVRLAVAPTAAEQDFEIEPPSSWLLARLPCTRLAHVITAKVATAKEAQMLGLVRGAALLVSERRTWSDDEPVSWVRLLFPGERNEFSGEFNPLNP